MNDNPYPITNEAGKLFCMAQRTPDGDGVVLKGKNCDISLAELQKRVMNPKKYAPRNKRPSNRKCASPLR